MNNIKITVSIIVSADIGSVWDAWTKPDRITKWNFASDDWQCPSVENDLKVGGKYFARMEAKDGSFGFDFEAIYDKVIPRGEIAYTMLDGRQVATTFEDLGTQIKITTTFDAETLNAIEMQEKGWQLILDNFKRYVEKE